MTDQERINEWRDEEGEIDWDEFDDEIREFEEEKWEEFAETWEWTPPDLHDRYRAGELSDEELEEYWRQVDSTNEKYLRHLNMLYEGGPRGTEGLPSLF